MKSNKNSIGCSELRFENETVRALKMPFFGTIVLQFTIFRQAGMLVGEHTCGNLGLRSLSIYKSDLNLARRPFKRAPAKQMHVDVIHGLPAILSGIDDEAVTALGRAQLPRHFRGH